MMIVEFVDLLCPACKFSSPTVLSFVRAKADIDLVIKLFPLDGHCSASPEMPKGSGLRCQWSYAVLCAQKAGHGEKALKWVFDQQERLSRSTFESESPRFIADLGLDAEALRVCMATDETKTAVLKMSQEGLDGKIRGTPSIFANGRIVSRGQNSRVLEEIYRNIK
jgi:protein-disulfide isomerase